VNYLIGSKRGDLWAWASFNGCLLAENGAAFNCNSLLDQLTLRRRIRKPDDRR
jgi:hypothetical protein